MKYFISIGVVFATLGGWVIAYEPFGVWFPKDLEGNPPPDYWYWYDIVKSVLIFLCSLWPFAGKLSIKWRMIAFVQVVYFTLNLSGDIVGINEKGNWFTYLSGALFISLLVIPFLPKWAYYFLFTPRKP